MIGEISEKKQGTDGSELKKLAITSTRSRVSKFTYLRVSLGRGRRLPLEHEYITAHVLQINTPHFSVDGVDLAHRGELL